MRKIIRSAVLASVTFALVHTEPAAAQAQIKVNDDVSFKVGFLLQGQADWQQNAAAESYSQNLFVRRARFLVAGQVAKNVSFFFETDNPNLGKVANGAKVTSGFIVQDAFVSWKVGEALIVDGGLFLTGIAHNSLQSAASLLAIDYGPHSFLFSGPEQNVVGRDTGFQLRGYPAKKKLEYRVGVWQGSRDTASRQALRGTARLQYNFLDADTGVFYSGTSLGKKRILTIGGGYDFQKDYKSWAGDLFFDLPVGSGAVSGQFDWIRYDGGTYLANLPKQDVLYGEAGLYLSAARLMPYGTWAQKDVAGTEAGDETRWTAGLAIFVAGHNFNIKAAYGKVEPRIGRSADQFTIQMQAFYF